MQRICYQTAEIHRKDRLLRWRYLSNWSGHFFDRDLPKEFQRDGFQNQHHFIRAWTNFAQVPFVGAHRQSDLPCWEGHYEQFGLLMLHIALASYHRGNDGCDNAELVDLIVPETEFRAAEQWNPSSRESGWYKAWFSMIGHPHFRYIDARTGPESMELQYRKFALRLATELVIENGII